jgi:hypothetical protein
MNDWSLYIINLVATLVVTFYALTLLLPDWIKTVIKRKIIEILDDED